MREDIFKVLVVDDEKYICDILNEYLSLQGYEVKIAVSGEEALDKFDEDRFDLVLLDVSLPGMSGMDVLARIKKMDAGTGVIMLSGYGDFNIVKEALQTGADHYMQKPMELERLNKLINRWREASGAMHGDLAS